MSEILPRIAVLVAAYNAEDTIQRTINCLNTDKEPHDIIVVDDASRTPAKDAIKPQDNLKVLRLEKNHGQAGARNAGLAYIMDKGYEFVCINDADDTASPERLKMFREFLDAHPDYGVVGSWVRYVNETGRAVYYLKLPVDHEEIVKGLHYNNCLFWGLYRTEALGKVGVYEEGCMSEDYDLTRRVARHYKVKNLPYFLCDYTISPDGISQKRALRQMLSLLRLQLKHFRPFCIHAYIGLFKTLLRLALRPLRGRKEWLPSAEGKTAPVYIWRRFSGQQYEGEKEI